MVAGMIRQTLGTNLTALALLAVDSLPAFVVRSDLYRRLRRLASKNPKRFAEDRAAGPEDWPGRRLVTRDTDLVVDGFPGSGNSFVSNCLRDSAAGARLESHFHYTVQLKRALALGVPAVVIVRQPAAAWSSLKSKEPALFDWLIALRWILYHSYVRRHLATLHVFLFEDVTADLDLLRRSCSAVRRIVAGRLEADPGYRRASKHRTAVEDSGPLLRLLGGRAAAIYREIREGRRTFC